jgi:hypothetical protein
MRDLSIIETVHVSGAGVTADVFANIGDKIASTIGNVIGSAIPFLGVHIYKNLGDFCGLIGSRVGALFGGILETIFSNPQPEPRV